MRRLIAALALLPLVTVAQIRVCQNGVCDGGIAKQQVNCQEPIECKLDAVPGGAVQIALDSGFSSGGSAWQTACDQDFRTLAPIPLDGGNGSTYPIFCGYSLTAVQTGSVATGMDLPVDGGGITIRPNSSSDVYNTQQNDPGFYITPSDIVPNMTWDTPIRMTCDMRGNFSAQYDHVGIMLGACSSAGCSYGLGNPNTIGHQRLVKAWRDHSIPNFNAPLWNMSWGQNGTSAETPVDLVEYGEGYYGGSVGTAEWALGVGQGVATGYADIPDAGAFPTAAPHMLVGRVRHTEALVFRVYGGSAGAASGIAQVKLYIIAGRSGSATTFFGHFLRCKLEYKP